MPPPLGSFPELGRLAVLLVDAGGHVPAGLATTGRPERLDGVPVSGDSAIIALLQEPHEDPGCEDDGNIGPIALRTFVSSSILQPHTPNAGDCEVTGAGKPSSRKWFGYPLL